MENNKIKRYLRQYIQYYLDNMPNYNQLFYLGYLYHESQALRRKKAKPDSDNWSALWTLKKFKESVERLHIQDKALTTFLEKNIKKLSEYPETTIEIKDEDAEEIRQELSGMWEHFVNDTLQSKKIILEIDDTTLNPKKLRAGVSGFFTEAEIKKIAEVIQEDLKDGMTNMLLGLWTPSVMINLRVVEGILRRFYKKKTGKNAVPRIGKFINWGKILKELRGKKVKRELMVDLGYLNGKRNEAEHPDKRFTQEEAESIFNRGVYVIKGMISEI